MALLLPRSFFSDPRTPDPAFVRRLTDYDPALTVYWNRFRGRWIIDRCIRGAACAHAGHCERVTAMVVESPDKGYLPLNDRALEMLRARDLWRQFGSAEEMGATQDAQRDAQRARIEQSIRDDFRHAALDDRVQLNRVRALIQTHDMRVNR